MKVIVAGMPKTGTKSMNAALTRLGYKVYDYPENSVILCDEYCKIINEGWTTEDFRKMYENVDAVVDFPAQFFWDEILLAFPNAKVILTMRDDEEQWVKSFRKQTEENESSFIVFLMKTITPTGRKAMDVLCKLSPMVYGTPSPSAYWRTKINDSLSKKVYRAHNAYVLRAAPKDRLLVFKCSEGWAPLCKFLGVPIPDELFPHKNKGASIVKEIDDYPELRKLKREVFVSSALLMIVTSATAVVVYKYGFSGISNFFGQFVQKLVNFV